MEKKTPTGIRFIPIQHQLDSVSRLFYQRPPDTASEYLLAEIYLVLSCAAGFQGIGAAWREHVYGVLETQLSDEAFAQTSEGKFTRLVTYLHKRIKIYRMGNEICERNGQAVLEDAFLEHLSPCSRGGLPFHAGCCLEVSLPRFGGAILKKLGTASDHLRLIVTE